MQNSWLINKVYYGNVKVANYRLGSKFVPKNSPTVEFDTSVVHHSNTLRKIWLEIKWHTTVLNVSTENFREQRNIRKDSAVSPNGMFQTCSWFHSASRHFFKPSLIPPFSSLLSSFSVTGTDCTNSKGNKSSGTKFNSSEFCLLTKLLNKPWTTRGLPM